METAPLLGTLPAAGEQHAGATNVRSAAPRLAIKAGLVRLQQAFEQARYLGRALASSQTELVASRRQVDILTRANARLRELVVRYRPARGGHSRALLAPPAIEPHGAGFDAAPCSTWKQNDFCLSAGLGRDAMPQVERLLAYRRRFRRGEVLYRTGDRLSALYAIRSGSCKSALLAKDGQAQVAGYHMAGEIIGIDGIGTGLHECDAIALEDMEACPLPYDQIEHLVRLSEQFRNNLQGLLSQESARARCLMILLGTMRAEQRLAAFLLDMSQRYQVRGYSSREFVLRMTREEIGSYIGLKLETVSRLFSKLQREGLIHVEGRAVELLDQAALNRLVSFRA